MSTLENKIAGAIYGFAIGDAMGATTEFLTSGQIRNRFESVTDIIGGGWLNLKAGEVTDDTQMSMCVMDALMKYPNDIKKFQKKCMKNFVEWFEHGPKDVGGQCAKGIQCFMYNNSFIPEDSKALGNGSLMRAMPCALVGKVDFNVAQGNLTHNNLECSQVIQDYSRMIQDYLYNKIYTYQVKDNLKPSGYLWNTFNNSIYWSNEPTFEQAIIGAVNHGGDADTIAAITGSLAGARFGYNSIPERWIDQLNLDVKLYLEKFKNFVIYYVQSQNNMV